MKKTEIMNRASGIVSKISMKLKKYSPEILVAVGVTGTVVSAVMACKATTKISTIMDSTKETVDKIHKCLEDESMSSEYTKKDGQRDLTIVYAQTGLNLVKLYAPSVILGTFSIASILTSNNILKKRNIALAAAYATVNKGFKEYRNRVVERFGSDIDRELRYNVKVEKTETTITDENENEKTVEKVITTVDTDHISDYLVCYDRSTSKAWEENQDYNRMFLRAQQSLANDKLIASGRLFLNEVYDMLDMERTKAGQIVGWVYNPKNPGEKSDGYVDFGMFETQRKTENGYEPVIMLDFNVDGNVWDLM